MGSICKARCSCGYEQELVIGGGRQSFLEDSRFPFYCVSCGIVSVNVARLPDRVTELNCPKCKSYTAIQYGVPPVSVHDFSPKGWRFWRSEPTVEPQIQWGSRQASEDGHICPECKKITLKFSKDPGILFD